MRAEAGLEYLRQVGLRVDKTTNRRAECIVHPRSPCLLACGNERIAIRHGTVGIEVGRRLRSRVVVQMKVPGGNIQGTPTVRRAHAVRAVIRESACCIGKTVQPTETESRIVRALVLDR